jgi:ribosome-associated protein
MLHFFLYFCRKIKLVEQQLFEKIQTELTFQTARSGGAGGQNVNKVETKVELRFDVSGSAVLTEAQRTLLLEKLHNQLTTEGVLVLQHQTERSQLANKEKVVKKFEALLKKAFTVAKPRKATRKPAAVVAKIREDKARRSEVKALRKKII